MQVPTSLGCPAPLMGVPAPSSSTASSLKDDGWMGVLHPAVKTLSQPDH
jgi:hypothetical protein